MSTPTTTQAELKAIVNGMVHAKFAQCGDPTGIMNRAVKAALGEADLRSMKRTSQFAPDLAVDQFEYTAPVDLKANKIIDIRKQVNRPASDRFTLVDPADFDRLKNKVSRRVAVRDASYQRTLLVDGIEGTDRKTLNALDSLTGNGTWAASGDASNIALDTHERINGASFNFDTATGATTAILSTSSMTAVDLSDFDEQGSIYMWVFVPDTFTIASITNFILRWGNDASNYWSKTVTVANDGIGFRFGWNLLRFDWSSAIETGTVNPALIDYLHFTITKSGAQAADTDWRIDEMIFRRGEIYYVDYYSKYGWLTTAGVYIEESTTTTDVLVADTEEIEIIASKAAEYAAQELKDYDDMKVHQGNYLAALRRYQANNPSEALKITRSYGMMPRFQ